MSQTKSTEDTDKIKALALVAKGDLVEASVERLVEIDTADRSGWDQKAYAGAISVCAEHRDYSSMVLAKLCAEAIGKFGRVAWLEEEAKLDRGTIYQYARTYRLLRKHYPTYVYDGFFSWAAIRIMAQHSASTGDDLKKLMGELQDSGKQTVTNVVRETTKRKKEKENKPFDEKRPRKPMLYIEYSEELKLFTVKGEKFDFQNILGFDEQNKTIMVDYI